VNRWVRGPELEFEPPNRDENSAEKDCTSEIDTRRTIARKNLFRNGNRLRNRAQSRCSGSGGTGSKASFSLPLPLAVLGSFLFMHYADISSKIKSLGGIAIGALVHAGIVMTQKCAAACRKLSRRTRVTGRHHGTSALLRHVLTALPFHTLWPAWLPTRAIVRSTNARVLVILMNSVCTFPLR
jgi:hypothetical protein